MAPHYAYYVREMKIKAYAQVRGFKIRIRLFVNSKHTVILEDPAILVIFAQNILITSGFWTNLYKGGFLVDDWFVPCA